MLTGKNNLTKYLYLVKLFFSLLFVFNIIVYCIFIQNSFVDTAVDRMTVINLPHPLTLDLTQHFFLYIFVFLYHEFQ